MMTAIAIRTTSRFTCERHRLRYFLTGEATTVYSDLHDLQQTHKDCR